MRRRLTQLVFALGLLLTLAAGAMWVRGLWIVDSFSVSRRRTSADGYVWDGVYVSTSGRRFSIVWVRSDPYLSPGSAMDDRFQFRHATQATAGPLTTGGAAPLWRRLGFSASARRLGSNTLRTATVPPWSVVLPCITGTAISTLALCRERRRLARARGGLCHSCGYDLRGADHERCPECGETVAPVARV